MDTFASSSLRTQPHRPLRIIHLVYSLEMGGAEVLVGQLCRIQRRQGHDVTIFAYAKLGVIGEALRDEGFTIYVPGEAHPFRTMRRYFDRFRTMKPDVVHCHNVAPTTHGAIPAWLARVPCVLSTRHRLELHPYDLKQELQFNVMGWFCDWITGICEVTCVGIRKGPLARRKRVVLVYNGTQPIVRANFDSLGKRGFTLVYVGRLVPEKAVGMLIRAAIMAQARVPGLALWIVGDGKARAGWEALTTELDARDVVTFWGQQTRTAPFFSAADVFTMASISEGLPMSLLQAMSLGTPQILTDVDGMGEVLRLTGGGLLVPVGDVQAFADAIVRVAQDETLRAELSRKALEAYHAQFTLERMAEGYMQLYRTCGW